MKLNIFELYLNNYSNFIKKKKKKVIVDFIATYGDHKYDTLLPEEKKAYRKDKTHGNGSKLTNWDK